MGRRTFRKDGGATSVETNAPETSAPWATEAHRKTCVTTMQQSFSPETAKSRRFNHYFKKHLRYLRLPGEDPTDSDDTDGENDRPLGSKFKPFFGDKLKIKSATTTTLPAVHLAAVPHPSPSGNTGGGLPIQEPRTKVHLAAVPHPSPSPSLVRDLSNLGNQPEGGPSKNSGKKSMTRFEPIALDYHVPGPRMNTYFQTNSHLVAIAKSKTAHHFTKPLVETDVPPVVSSKKFRVARYAGPYSGVGTAPGFEKHMVVVDGLPPYSYHRHPREKSTKLSAALHRRLSQAVDRQKALSSMM